jgi:hypothetical protein
MIETLFLRFIQAWVLGLLALVAGRYVGQGSVKLPSRKGLIVLMSLEVWGITFIAQIAFSYLGHSLQWSDSAQMSFAEFLLPLAAGAYLARQLMRLQMRREVQRTSS